MKRIVTLLGLLLLLSACASQPAGGTAPSVVDDEGLATRHQADLPSEYVGLTNPVAADEASLERGKTLYTTNCASCHGEGGLGDGPAGSALNPPPAPVGQTSQTMSEDYLFWRISEGGAQFGTTMPGWKALNEQARWDMINYLRALGSGTLSPNQGLD